MKENKIRTIKLADVLVASLTYKGAYKDVGKYLDLLYETTQSNIKDKPFTIFHGRVNQDGDCKIELCMPLRKHVNYYDTETKILKGGEAFSITHIGPYDSISESYRLLTEFALDHGLFYTLSFREYYRKGPGIFFKGNPLTYRTEIIVLI